MVYLAWFFYRSPFGLVITAPVLIPFYREGTKRREGRKKEELSVQFRMALGSMITALKAGYSSDNAVRETWKEMCFLYGEKSAISLEFARMIQGMRSRVPLEKLMLEFGERSGISDIREFAEVFATARRTGGDMADIMERSVSLLEQRMEVEQEIRVMLSSRRIETRIMNIVPFVIVLYISVTSPDFFAPLFHNLKGIAIMTGCLAAYLAAVFWSEKITGIEI